ncbi:MAG: helix-turn-helix transcriptional regulator [Gammaproteobacteria bacterium]|nr:helix-turn-helix transcriptional regulator [Gammaproteobacteria bacterium]
MSAFGELLKQRRKDLNLTRKVFAQRAGLSEDYLTDIEIRSKTPSVEMLFDIIRIASCKNAAQVETADVEKEKPDWREVNNEVFMAMILATKGIYANDLLLSAHADFQREIEEQHGEVWILSNILAEAIDPEVAKRTAENIRKKDMSYRFFVPYSARSHWETAVEQIEDALGSDRKLMAERVRVYRVADLAFNCRLRISQPGSETAQARYSVGGTTGTNAEFVPAPLALIERTTTLLGELCNKADAGRPSVDPTVGCVERVYPPLKPSAKKRPKGRRSKS